MFYDCFTEDKYWSRKAIEIHNTKLKSHPDIQDNLSSFDGLFPNNLHGKLLSMKNIYRNFVAIMQCLRLAGESYERISDQENELKCYEKILAIDERRHRTSSDKIKIEIFIKENLAFLPKYHHNLNH